MKDTELNEKRFTGRPPAPKADKRLTDREREMLGYVAGGNSNKQIAAMLDIREQTVKNRMTTIFLKLKARDRAHAVSLATGAGWI